MSYNTNIKQTTGNNRVIKTMTTDLNNELKNIIERVKNRVEKEVPDTGYFRNFAENFNKNYKPDFYGKNIALFVQRDEQRDGRAFLGVSVLHPTMNTHASTYIMNGDRDKILEYLKDNNFEQEFKETVLELSESLKKY